MGVTPFRNMPFFAIFWDKNLRPKYWFLRKILLHRSFYHMTWNWYAFEILLSTLMWMWWFRYMYLNVMCAGVLLMYWKMTFCPKFIRCFGLLFVLKLEILKTQFSLTRDKSWMGLDWLQLKYSSYSFTTNPCIIQA